MLHVPDTGPGKRVPGAGARTEGREASRQSSEVGAVCRKAARTVLCGGRPVMGVPTAIATFGSLTGLRDTRSGQSSWLYRRSFRRTAREGTLEEARCLSAF